MREGYTGGMHRPSTAASQPRRPSRRRQPDAQSRPPAVLTTRDVAAIYDDAPPLYRLARCLVGSAAAEIVVVELLVDACRRPTAVEAGGSLRSQLVRLTYQRCRDLRDR